MVIDIYRWKWVAEVLSQYHDLDMTTDVVETKFAQLG